MHTRRFCNGRQNQACIELAHVSNKLKLMQGSQDATDVEEPTYVGENGQSKSG